MTLYYKYKRHNKRVLLIILLTLFFLLTYFFSQLSPTFIELSKNKIYATVSKIVSETVLQEVNEIDADSLVLYQYDNEGKITAVNANVVVMNILNSTISRLLTEKLNNIKDLYVKIPIGSIIVGNFFAGEGPLIPLKIHPINTVTTKYRTEFFSTGINQTIHKIFIQVNCSIDVLSWLSTQHEEISIEIPIAETIIIGNVPSTFLEMQTNN